MAVQNIVWRANFLILFFISMCNGVINHLNDTEYDRMPPIFTMDDYGRCMSYENGTYCFLRVELFAEPENELMKLIEEYSANTIKHYNHSFLQKGVCLTKTCKNYIGNYSIRIDEDQTKILQVCLNDSIYNEYGLQANIGVYYCEKKGETLDIDLWDWIALGVYIALFTINFVGTMYDAVLTWHVSENKGNKYLLSFSVIQNWRRLTSPETEEVKSKKLQGFHGVRVLTLFLMLVSHVIFIQCMGTIDNSHDFEKYYDTTYYQLIFNGLIVVQVFFGMSGFLLVYNLEWYAEKNHVSWLLAPKVWMIRWWRLTPSYAVVMLFMCTWLRHLGSGPLWRYFVTDSVVTDCRNYWWAHLLYINNYIDDGHYCAIQTWHIATDTQLFCIGLLAYMITRNGGKYIVFGALAALGVVLPAAHTWAWDLDGLVISSPEFYRTFISPTFHNMHAYGHNNLECYVMGMITAYVVYRLQKNNVDITNNKICIIIAWLLIPCTVALFYSGSIFYAEGERASLALRVAFAAAHRLSMGAIASCGMLGLSMKLNTVLREVFEWSMWLIPSRLSYSVYLLHLFIIHAHIGLMTQMGHASTFNMTIFHLGVLLLTFMIALPFSLMVEAPLMRIMKLVTTPDKKETTKF